MSEIPIKLRRGPTSIAFTEEDEEESEEAFAEVEGAPEEVAPTAGPTTEEKNGGVDLMLRIS